MSARICPANQRSADPIAPSRFPSTFNLTSSIAIDTTRPPHASTMPALANTSRAIARSWTAHQLPVVRASCASMQTRNLSEASATSSFDSPFKGAGSSTKIPSFAAYRNKSGGETGPRVFSYFMVGTMGALASLGAKNTVQGKSPQQTSMELWGHWNLWNGCSGRYTRAIGPFADDLGSCFDGESLS